MQHMSQVNDVLRSHSENIYTATNPFPANNPTLCATQDTKRDMAVVIAVFTQLATNNKHALF